MYMQSIKIVEKSKTRSKEKPTDGREEFAWVSSIKLIKATNDHRTKIGFKPIELVAASFTSLLFNIKSEQEDIGEQHDLSTQYQNGSANVTTNSPENQRD